MSSTTASGWPYPQDSDPVADGGQAIAALAQALEAKIQHGEASINNAGANTPSSVDVVFPTPYPVGTSPIVMVTPNATTPGSHVTGWSASNITNTGCKVWVTRSDAASPTSVMWLAIG